MNAKRKPDTKANNQPKPLPCVICGGSVWEKTPVFPEHQKRDIHPACYFWPNSGVIYGVDLFERRANDRAAISNT